VSRILALDVGDRRVGIAATDPSRTLASPLETYQRSSEGADIAHVKNLAAIENASLVVVGLPVNMDGSEGSQAEKTRKFAESLAQAGLAIQLWDERLTSVEATRRLRDLGYKPKDIARRVDELAAVLILEDYMRYLDSEAVSV
jgi:putative Holliday junction resolvase